MRSPVHAPRVRVVLAVLLAANVLGAALLATLDAREARTRCEPTDGPAASLRVATVADDGCGGHRLRLALHVPVALLVADALALGVALAWRSRWRAWAAALPLAGLVVLAPAALLASRWGSGCGPVETYLGPCASPAWLLLPWIGLCVSTVAAVLIEARAPRAPPSPPR